ncbi:hypothetical protein SteCoe_34421 [Stentor coeruleus]|uniref:SF-assemblin n=1 Tax=Stentor coeruleus TaxID=5963 RepID=A0A1R2AUJ6_9CILI|nr:hypothetical protein SteCoe_34421 [Stentor coeruleus]
MNKQKMDSGYKDRVKRLSERLQGIQVNLETDRGSRFVDLEKKLDSLEKDFNDSLEQNAKKFSTVKEQIQKIEKTLDEELHLRDSFFEIKSQEIAEFQARIQEAFTKSMKIRKENENKIYKVIDEKVENIKSKMTEENKALKDSEAEARGYIEQDVPKLYEFVQNCIADREEMEGSLNKKLEGGLADIENDLAVETKTREETEEAMLAMLRDVVSRIKSDLEQERKERESSEETLLSLLEETCSKLATVTNY